MKNDGSRTNREAFWEYMEESLPLPPDESEKIALAFYEGDFNKAVCTTNPTPVSDQIVKAAKEKKIETYLATNPVFPRIATMNRIRWAGLDADDFKLITTYESCRYCKPNPRYFEQILDAYDLNPEECLMVGNDVEEDLSIRSLNVKTFLVTDTMENKKNLSFESEYTGSLKELLAFINQL